MHKLESVFKNLGWVFGLLFVVSAVLQYNDPDPLLWIIIYLIAAAISITFALNKISYIIPSLAALVGLIGTYYVFPTKFEGFEIGAGDIKNIEEGREAFGLLIVSLIMLLFAAWSRFGRKSQV